jgi:RHS repeat-associated protein
MLAALFALTFFAATPARAEWEYAAHFYSTFQQAQAAAYCNSAPGCVFVGVSSVPMAGGCTENGHVPSICQPNELWFNWMDNSTTVNTGFGVGVVNCPTGTVPDVGAPTGCAPPNGVQPPKSLGTGACGDGCPSSTGNVAKGEPIDIGSGNVTYSFTDYTTAGQNPLSFTRYYNSRTNFFGMLGSNWRTTYDRYIYALSTTSVIVERPNGQQFTFNFSGSTWATDSDVDYQLSQSGSTFTLTDPDDTVETYTMSSANVISLTTIKARNGYTQTLNYSGSTIASVTDSYSRTLTFAYTNALLSGITTPDSTTISYSVPTTTLLLASVTYPTSPASSVTYSYGAGGAPASALTSITDENGNTYQAWTYDSYARGLTSAQGGSSLNANLTTIAYNDTTGNRTVQTGPNCPSTSCVTDTYSFTTLLNVPKVSGISRAATSTTAAATESFGYDTNGYRNAFTDWNGNQTTYTNATNGMPTTINEAVGSSVARTTTITYDTSASPPLPHSPLTIVTPGLTTTYTYDINGDVLTRTLADTTTQSVPYSTNGQTRTWTNTWGSFLLATVKSPNGNTTTFGYDSSGALTSIKNALNQTTTITSHMGGGLPETIVDPNGSTNGITTTLTYDPRQRLIKKAVGTSAGTETTTYALDPAGNLTKLTLADNSYISRAYDAAHRVTQATNALGEYQTYTLDGMGDQTQVNTFDSSNNTWRQQSRTFDALGRETKYVGGSGLDEITYAYDPNGNTLTVTDGNSHATNRIFDALNRLSKTTDANSGVTQLAYDAHDRHTSVTDANANVTAYVYSGFGDDIQIASTDTGTAVYHYDSDANLTQAVDGAGVTANMTYDVLDRITSKQFPADTTQDLWYGYDQTGYPYSNNEVGRVSYIVDAAGHYTFAYDTYGNVDTRRRYNGSGTDISDIWPTHDAVNRVAGIAYPSGLWVGFNRDAAGQVGNVAINPPGSLTPINVDWAAYAPFYGPLRYETSGNNIQVSKFPDRDYRPYLFTMQNSGGTNNLINQTLGYDTASNLTSVSDTVNAFNNQTLGYDVINRLTSATSGTGGYGSLAWTYDKVGNLQSQTVNSSTTTYGYTSGSNRLASITHGGTISVTTNGNGNITSIPPADAPGTAATFTYNVANRLATVTGSPVGETLVYDAFGQRYSKQDPGTNPTTYVYDLDGNLIEENDNGAVLDYIYNNRTLVGLWVPSTSTLYYVHTNYQNTPIAVTNSSQAIVWSTAYQPYGTTSIPGGSISQNVRLPGQYLDTETGFYYNGFRDYMPNLGRYLEADLIGLRGGVNPFLYAHANPLAFIDPFGLDPLVLPPPAGAPAYTGPVTAGSSSTPITAYRYYGGTSSQMGYQNTPWLSPIEYPNSQAAAENLALPSGNTASTMCRVTIPPGTQFQIGFAAPNFNQPGGGLQIQPLETLPPSAFGEATPVPAPIEPSLSGGAVTPTDPLHRALLRPGDEVIPVD